MADFVLAQQRVLFGAIDVSGRVNAVALDYGADMVDNTALGDFTRSFLAGLKNAAVAIEGFWDGTDLDPTLFAALGASGLIPVSVMESAVEGARSFTMQAVEAQYEGPSGAVGDMAAFSARAQSGDGTGGLIRSTLIHNQARTSSGNGTGFQLGAVSSTQRVYGALHVLAASAADTLDVIVQSDTSGFASPTTRLTFAQKAAVGSEFLSAAGPITDDFWRVNFTIGGSSPSFTFAVVLGIQ